MGDVWNTLLSSLGSDPTRTYPEVRELIGGLVNMAQFYVTSVTGNAGSTVDVTTPGDPKAAIVVNGNDGTFGIKIYGMATSSAVKGNATGPTISFAANMITLATNKITIGNDAQLNTTHTLHVLVFI